MGQSGKALPSMNRQNRELNGMHTLHQPHATLFWPQQAANVLQDLGWVGFAVFRSCFWVKWVWFRDRSHIQQM